MVGQTEQTAAAGAAVETRLPLLMQSVIEHPVPVMQVMLPRRPVVPHELSWLPWFTQELIRV